MGKHTHKTDRAPRPDSSAAPPTGPVTTSRPTILVADHDPTVRALLQATLYRTGFAVCLAADGPEAIDVYQRDRFAITLVLLDLHLEGGGGLEILAELKKLNSRVRCCFTASNLGDVLMQELLASGALRVFMKPFPLAEVAQELRLLAGAETACEV